MFEETPVAPWKRADVVQTGAVDIVGKVGASFLRVTFKRVDLNFGRVTDFGGSALAHQETSKHCCTNLHEIRSSESLFASPP